MATNPLQVPVMGGSLDTPVAGVGVATPMLSGPNVVPNRTISDIMSTLSGVANAVTGVAQIKIESDRATKQRQSEIERNELSVWQKNADLWKTQTELLGPEVIKENKTYQTFLADLQAETGNPNRSPVFQAETAKILQMQYSYQNSEQRMLDRDREQQQFRNEQRLEQAGRQAWRELELEIGKSRIANPAMSLEEIENTLVRPFSDIPEVSHNWEVYKLKEQQAAAKQQAEALEETAKSEFVGDAGIIENSFLTLTNPRLSNPQLYNAAESNAKQAINDMFSQNAGYDLSSIAAIDGKWEEVSAQFALVKDPTDVQQSYMNALTAQYTRAREQYVDKMQANALNRAKVSIDAISKFGTYDPTNIQDTVVTAINEQLGADVISYKEGVGYVSMDPSLGDLEVAAGDMQNKLMTEWVKDLPVRQAQFQVRTAPVLSDETLKAAKFDPATATISEIDSVSRKVRKGSDLGIFEGFVKGVLSNPKLPDGSYDGERIQKALTILDNMDVAQSILLRGDTTINDAMTARILRASVWAEMNKAKGTGILSDTTQRDVLGPVVGPTQQFVDASYMERFIFGPSEISGSNSQNALEPDTQDILKLHPGLVVSNPLMNALQYADRFYLMDHPKGFPDPEVRKMYHKQVLRASGVSLIDDGRGRIYPVADEYGHAPSTPLDTASKALDLIPEPGSPLHTSALAQFTNGAATLKDVEETKNMSIREMFRKYNKVDIKDSDLVITSAATFPEGPAPLPEGGRGAEGGVRGFSDYEYRDLFGYGVSITNGSQAAAEIRINSQFESLLNDPLFGAQEKKNAKAAKFLKSQTYFIDDLIGAGDNARANDKRTAERMRQ